MNCWRCSGREVYKEVVRIKPVEAKAAKKVPPRCIGGRWGSVSECEERVLALSPDVFRGAFTEVARQKAAKRRSAPAAAGVEDLVFDEGALHTFKMNKWWARATDAVNNPQFLPMSLFIIHTQRAPFDNFLNWLKKEKSTKDSRSPGGLAQLVWHKSAEFMKECHDNMLSPSWDGLLGSAQPSFLVPLLTEVIAAGTLCIAAEYSFRVHSRVALHPYKLLLLAKNPPNVRCRDRHPGREHRAIHHHPRPPPWQPPSSQPITGEGPTGPTVSTADSRRNHV